MGFQIHGLPLLGYPISSQILSISLTLLWILLITNSFNLIDGLDGLSGGLAFIAGLTLLSLSLVRGDVQTALPATVLCGAVAGFLRYNFHPASIFMGSSGSLFLGYVLSLVALRSSAKGVTAVAILAPLLALGLPLFDTLLAVARRFLRAVHLLEVANGRYRFLFAGGRGLFEADREHVHHRLLAPPASPTAGPCLKPPWGRTRPGNPGAPERCPEQLPVWPLPAGHRPGQRGRAEEAGLPGAGGDAAGAGPGALRAAGPRPPFFSSLLRPGDGSGGLLRGLRPEGGPLRASRPFKELFLGTLFALLAAKLLPFYALGIYRRSWRHSNIADMIGLGKALLIGSLLFALPAMVMLSSSPPASVLVIDFRLFSFLTAVARTSFRWLEYVKFKGEERERRVLIYGAGRGGGQGAGVRRS